MSTSLSPTWAAMIVDALAASGVARVVISPGARSAPLAIACEAHPALTIHVLVDERSAGFFALGLARASGRPVALVCSSGTAGANYHPAVIEADRSGVPLVVLTADRPARLRHLGAPQTIDQHGLFGTAARMAVTLPEPAAGDQPMRAVARYVAEAVAVARGPAPGPVHLNCPFDEPLTGPASADRPAAPRVHPGKLVAADAAIDEAAGALAAARRPIMIAGPDAGDAEALGRLAKAWGMPLVADVGSGLRGTDAIAWGDLLLRLPAWQETPADLVVRVGGAPTAKGVQLYLQRHAPTAIALRPDARPHDPEAIASVVVTGDVADAARRLAERAPKTDGAWPERWARADAEAAAFFGQSDAPMPYEAAVVRRAIAALPPGAALCLSNSLPIRHVDTYGGRLPADLAVHVYRGANGIDGVTSTSLGVAAAARRPVMLVTGDLAFLHDLGGLAAARQLASPMVVLVLNNDGGGIFSYLPLADTPPFEPLFGTPHGHDFAPAAAMFGLGYVRAESLEAVADAVRAGFAAPGLTVVEVPTDRAETAASHKAAVAAIAERLSEVPA